MIAVRCFNLISEYQKPGKDKVDIEFFSLYKDLETKKILCESAKDIVKSIDWNNSALLHKGLSWITQNYLRLNCII
ncbi:hypothetical protein GCM10023142_34890 [Anaerocolumna aminovalerica]